MNETVLHRDHEIFTQNYAKVQASLAERLMRELEDWKELSDTEVAGRWFTEGFGAYYRHLSEQTSWKNRIIDASSSNDEMKKLIDDLVRIFTEQRENIRREHGQDAVDISRWVSRGDQAAA